VATIAILRRPPGGASAYTMPSIVTAVPAIASEGSPLTPLPSTPAVGNHRATMVTRAIDPTNTARCRHRRNAAIAIATDHRSTMRVSHGSIRLTHRPASPAAPSPVVETRSAAQVSIARCARPSAPVLIPIA
jgi:hypothetical protein